MVGKTASKLTFNDHDPRLVPGPGFVVASEDAAFACIVAVPGGPIKVFCGGSVCAKAFAAKKNEQMPTRRFKFKDMHWFLCLIAR